jgi:DNA-binding transcriptional ArsR family regulator
VEPVAQVFHALADPTRCEILRRLAAEGPLPTGRLIEGLSMSRQGASRHLSVLESAGLVVSKRAGRRVVCHLDPKPLRGSQEWLAEIGRAWDERLGRLMATYER